MICRRFHCSQTALGNSALFKREKKKLVLNFNTMSINTSISCGVPDNIQTSPTLPPPPPPRIFSLASYFPFQILAFETTPPPLPRFSNDHPSFLLGHACFLIAPSISISTVNFLFCYIKEKEHNYKADEAMSVFLSSELPGQLWSTEQLSQDI